MRSASTVGRFSQLRSAGRRSTISALTVEGRRSGSAVTVAKRKGWYLGLKRSSRGKRSTTSITTDATMRPNPRLHLSQSERGRNSSSASGPCRSELPTRCGLVGRAMLVPWLKVDDIWVSLSARSACNRRYAPGYEIWVCSTPTPIPLSRWLHPRRRRPGGPCTLRREL